jgi:hypothetical protein
MNRYDNVFLIGRRAADEKIGPEDLFTAQLAWLLRFDQELARAWAGHLTGENCEGHVDVLHWPYEGPDQPDMVLDLNGRLRVICEHKVESGLGDDQVARYLALAQREESRLDLPHRVALVTKNLTGIPDGCLGDLRYLRPADKRHFQWELLYEMLKSCPGSCTAEMRSLRKQFAEYMRLLSLDPAPLLPHLELLFADTQIPEARRQRQAFQRLWGPTRAFFEGLETRPKSPV